MQHVVGAENVLLPVVLVGVDVPEAASSSKYARVVDHDTHAAGRHDPEVLQFNLSAVFLAQEFTPDVHIGVAVVVSVVFYCCPERGRRHKRVWSHVQEVGQPVVGGVHLQRAVGVVGIDLDRHFCHSFRQQFETGKIRYIFDGFRLVFAQAQPL